MTMTQGSFTRGGDEGTLPSPAIRQRHLPVRELTENKVPSGRRTTGFPLESRTSSAKKF